MWPRGFQRMLMIFRYDHFRACFVREREEKRKEKERELERKKEIKNKEYILKLLLNFKCDRK
jgi:hypothetical protein